MKDYMHKILIFILILVTTLVSFSYAWFSSGNKYDAGFSATVVRYYFDSGAFSDGEYSDGTAAHPFRITKPIHLYNLSYLQNKGIFGTTDYYFEFGKPGADGTTYLFYSSSNANESTDTTTATYIDMSTLSTSYIFAPIGTDSDVAVANGSSDNPFVSHLIGHNLIIKNLTVVVGSGVNYGGMFGVVADNANISSFNLVNINVVASNIANTAATLGLVVGYANQSTSGSLTLNAIGVKEGEFSGQRRMNSIYSLIGDGSDTFKSTLANGAATGGDSGFIDFDAFAVYAGDNPGGGTTQAYDGYTNGIFTLHISSASSPANQSGVYGHKYNSSYTLFQNSSVYFATASGTAYNVSTASSSCAVSNLTSSTSNPNYYNAFANFYNYNYITSGSSADKKTQYLKMFSFPMSDSDYITFTTTKTNATINLVYVVSDFIYSNVNTKIVVNKMASATSSTVSSVLCMVNGTAMGSASGYLAFAQISVPETGTYRLQLYQSNYFAAIAYISVEGVQGGSIGQNGGLKIDFIHNESTVVASNSFVYTYVAFTITWTGTSNESYEIIFVRNDDTVKTVYAYKKVSATSMNVSLTTNFTGTGTITTSDPRT